MDDDELVFTVAGDSLVAAPFAFGDAVVLYRSVSGVTTRWFTGTAVDVRAQGSPKDARWAVVVRGPWFKLRQTMFQQANACYNAACAALTTIQTTKAVLFQDPITGLAITTGVQIQNVINYAVSVGIPIALGTAPAFLNMPFETVRDLTLADVIRRAAQATPDAVGWFDYSGATPVFNIQQRGSLVPVSVDFNASPSIIERFDVQDRGDLVPAGVRFNYIGMKMCAASVPATCTDDTNGVVNPGPGPVTASAKDQVSVITQDSIGIPDGPNGIVATIDLAQLGPDSVETPPVGLAAAYYNSLLVKQWQGTLVLREQECSGVVKMGKVLNLANGLAAWATMNALVQQVSEQLLTGETEITFGPPEHLSPQNFAFLVQLMRRRPLVTDAFPATRPPGNGVTVNCVAGKDPKAQDLINKTAGNSAAVMNNLVNGAGGGGNTNLTIKAIDVCKDGAATTVHLYGPPDGP